MQFLQDVLEPVLFAKCSCLKNGNLFTKSFYIGHFVSVLLPSHCANCMPTERIRGFHHVSEHNPLITGPQFQGNCTYTCPLWFTNGTHSQASCGQLPPLLGQDLHLSPYDTGVFQAAVFPALHCDIPSCALSLLSRVYAQCIACRHRSPHSSS